MKDGDGVSTLELTEKFNSATFRGIALTGPSETDKQRFASFKAKFFQALADNLTASFSGTESVLQKVSAAES